MPRMTVDSKSPRSPMKGSSLNESGQCDVFVWGSNSSHQLAEGSHDKIMLPKQATAFENVQMVRSVSSSPLCAFTNTATVYVLCNYLVSLRRGSIVHSSSTLTALRVRVAREVMAGLVWETRTINRSLNDCSSILGIVFTNLRRRTSEQ